MRSTIPTILLALTYASTSLLPLAASQKQQPFQKIPPTAAPNDGNYYTKPLIPENSSYFIHQQTNTTTTPVPPEYRARPIDIPMGLLNKGTLNFFKTGFNVESAPQNSPSFHKNDFANNTACGIPDSVHYRRRVAIHPYWLKYAPAGLGLGRFCMSDVCINIWNETGFQDGTTDIMTKVVDVCSTDPKDPSYCASPADIMIDREGADILYAGTPGKDLQAIRRGKQYPRQVWWFFTKCYQDGVASKAYNDTSGVNTDVTLLRDVETNATVRDAVEKNKARKLPTAWWATPPYPNNWVQWGIPVTSEQYRNNCQKKKGESQSAYEKAGFRNYGFGQLLQTDKGREAARFDAVAKDEWEVDKEGKLVEWCPVAGGSAKHGQPPNPEKCKGRGASVVDVS